MMDLLDFCRSDNVIAVATVLAAIGAAAFTLKRWFLGIGRSAGLADEQSVHSAVADLTAAITALKEASLKSDAALTKMIAELSTRVAAVEYQVSSNGGGSLRDKAVRSEARLEIIMEHLNL